MKIDLLMLKELTRREIEVCYHVAQARTNKEIAALLYVDSRTIEAHLYTIFMKTNYRNRTPKSNRAGDGGRSALE